MGAYLEKPRTEKDTETGTLDLGINENINYKGLPFAVSQMQGWRKTMEDAHIAATNLEKTYDVPENTSLFAVFDGHGGKEVALFAAKHFMETLVDLESFKARCYREALIECFHKMDEMLLDPKYRTELDTLSGILSRMDSTAVQAATFEEAEEKAVKGNTDMDLIENGQGDKKLLEDERRSSLEEEFRTSLETEEEDEESESETDNIDKSGISNEEFKELEKGEKLLMGRAESINFTSPVMKDDLKKGSEEDDDVSEDSESFNGGHKVLDELENGSTIRKLATPPELPARRAKTTDDVDDISKVMSSAENKGTLSKTEALNIMMRVLSLSRKQQQPPQKEPAEVEEEPVAVAKPVKSTGLGLFEETEKTIPTMAGATACVALIIEGKLYVANAGDSRSVLCRNKKAEPMSFDHKPDQATERERVERAGGWVTAMGRICGNLNLSRSIGDLKYKQNDELPKSAQVITAEPDVKCVELTEQDMFFVVACDGVWDIMTNDSIVEFIGKRLVDNAQRFAQVSAIKDRETQTVKQTVEDIFSSCICDDPMSAEGKGADNMTAMIICLRPLDDLLTAFWP